MIFPWHGDLVREGVFSRPNNPKLISVPVMTVPVIAGPVICGPRLPGSLFSGPAKLYTALTVLITPGMLS